MALVKHEPAAKDWKQEEKGTAEDEMVGWHHRFDGHEFEQVPGVGDGQGSPGASVQGVDNRSTELAEAWACSYPFVHQMAFMNQEKYLNKMILKRKTKNIVKDGCPLLD